MTTTENAADPAAPRTVSTAVAERDSSPAGLVKNYSSDFTQVMPSHVKPEAWVRIAVGALKKGKQVNTPHGPRYELEIAAGNNPGVFLASLLDAARLGLEPGTEQYYLTPRKVRGQLEILGIVGYQGIIELMYRAGAVSSVVAEVVYDNDEFDYQPGVDDVPRHRINWDAPDRGKLRLVYAYARMKGGATSKVVVLNRASIAAIKASSQGSSSEYSPWQKHEAAMWLKSAVRQLAKWVPTSAEYRTAETARQVTSSAPAASDRQRLPAVDRSTGEILDADVVLDREPDAASDHPDKAEAETVEAEVVADASSSNTASAEATVDDIAQMTEDELWVAIVSAGADMGGGFDVDADFEQWSGGTQSGAASIEELRTYLRRLLRGAGQAVSA
jgi:recombination protein RecT